MSIVKKTLAIATLTLGSFLMLPIASVLAETEIEQKITSAQVAADTAFMLNSSGLVLLMTVGLAFFYGGFVAKRNVLNTMMMSFIALGLVGVIWLVVGYSLAFAPGIPFIGGLQWAFLNGVGLETTGYLPVSSPEEMSSYSSTIPHQTFMIYQAMFAIITPALISGAIVERIPFRSYCIFIVLWLLIVYCPLAHMIWGKEGFLGLSGGLNVLDFAGGTVVHTASGVSALVAAIIIGPRKTYPDRIAPPHNVPFILLGAGLLWYGWFGFNAGSALSSGPLATTAFITTNTSAAAAMLTWLVLEQVVRGKPTSVGAATGIVVGLVGITPCAGFVTPMSAIVIGAIASVCCFYAIIWKVKLGIDDSLDTFPVHGVGGTVGTILAGIFATTAVNSGGKEGLFAGNPSQLLIQLAGVGLTILWAAIGTFIILTVVGTIWGLRVSPAAELQGMDLYDHGEEAYGEDIQIGMTTTEVK
ncbi:MAG: ammonium transporter [Snowella sp.]|nr:ammonium transporter [Snowella sp.]